MHYYLMCYLSFLGLPGRLTFSPKFHPGHQTIIYSSYPLNLLLAEPFLILCLRLKNLTMLRINYTFTNAIPIKYT